MACPMLHRRHEQQALRHSHERLITPVVVITATKRLKCPICQADDRGRVLKLTITKKLFQVMVTGEKNEEFRILEIVDVSLCPRECCTQEWKPLKDVHWRARTAKGEAVVL